MNARLTLLLAILVLAVSLAGAAIATVLAATATHQGAPPPMQIIQSSRSEAT